MPPAYQLPRGREPAIHSHADPVLNSALWAQVRFSPAVLYVVSASLNSQGDEAVPKTAGMVEATGEDATGGAPVSLCQGSRHHLTCPFPSFRANLLSYVWAHSWRPMSMSRVLYTLTYLLYRVPG